MQDNLLILEGMILSDFKYEPVVEKEIVVFHTSDIMLERIPRIYNEYDIIPAYMHMTDESGNLGEFKREVREWDVVLAFSNENDAPRKNPTELIYKGRKMKNKFTE